MASNLYGLDSHQVWDTELAFAQLQALGEADSKRTTERRIQALHLLPTELEAGGLVDELGRAANALLVDWKLAEARSKRKLALFAQLQDLPEGAPCLHANDARGARYWMPLAQGAKLEMVLDALQRLQKHIDKSIVVFPHGALVGLLRAGHAFADPADLAIALNVFPPVLELAKPSPTQRQNHSPHLQRLEAESIHILREAVAEANKPVMLYSVGKDSATMLHLARKAFYPAPPPFALLHVDTRWKFQEMYLLRDHMARASGMELLVHINPEAIAKDINPFDHGSALHTDITKTEGLKQALNQHQFDVVFGGARRDEEKSRAKERIFSFRTASHQWDPKNQRPELWNLYNTRKGPGESIRVFPLSNWTELDIWHYIYQEDIPVVPLYFAKTRPVVVRNGMILMVDDARFRLLPGEEIVEKQVRFRTLGCYPLTGAIESNATSLPDIILELAGARSSERQGRAIDQDGSASMEKKKQEGYF
jgi:sulfate adenylyltransferase subunit 2